jgi:hypothetical protein
MALPDPGGSSLVWRRSTFCTESGCLEVAYSGDVVFIRDSQSPGDTPLKLSFSTWRAFLRAAGAGECDLDQ